jgi:hypothetical protein
VTARKARGAGAEALVVRAFGADSRRRMLEEYFRTAGDVTVTNAWIHVYKLLLWIDTTTGLAHCYESDKCQPGRPWYERSLLFHDWIARELGSTPGTLSDEIDWLFKRGTEFLATAISRQLGRRTLRAAEQLAPYEGRGMPPPGEDPVLEQIIDDELGPFLAQPPPPDVMRRLTQRVRTHLSHENKRKNLVGEGFEDVIAFIINRLPGAERFELRTRRLLSQLPGFREPPRGEKERKVDLAIISPERQRMLVSAKWSVRADREEQFQTDYGRYTALEDWRQPFAHVLITNEFDAARLVAACDMWGQNAPLFSTVVHVNPAGPRAVYPRPRSGDAAVRLLEHIQTGRLTGLDHWLTSLLGA